MHVSQIPQKKKPESHCFMILISDKMRGQLELGAQVGFEFLT